MNKDRRASLRKAIKFINSAKDIVDMACDEESDCMDSMPENLQCSDKYDKMDEAVGNLENAISSLEDAEESIRSAM